MLFKYFRILLVFLTVLAWALCPVGCGDDDDDDSDDSGNDDDDSEDDDDDNDDSYPPFAVIYDYVIIEGEPAPPNPATNTPSPEKYNAIPLFRFRQDTGDLPPRPVKSIVILWNGFGAGASQFQMLALDLVEKAQGEIEVWVPDRRTALLEDQFGLDVAEAEKNPWIVQDYYFEGQTVNGQTFDGWLDAYSSDLDMLSEWGIDLQFEDYRRIVELVPEEFRRTNVYVGGHSQGVRTTMMFGAYEFPDGKLGSDLVAGLIFYDGKNQVEALTEFSYLQRLNDIRTGDYPRYDAQGLFGDPSIFFQLEYFGMLITDGFGQGDPQMGPDGHLNDFGSFDLILKFMARFRNVTLTNEAWFGLVLDDESGPINAGFSAHMGALTGGTLGQDAMGVYPNQNGASYSWLNYNEVDPEEYVDIQKMGRMLYEGPSDFIDLYYSSRLFLDHHLAGDMETEGTWRHDYVHYYTSRIDAPIFCVKSKYLNNLNVYSDYLVNLPPVRNSDKPRTEEGFTIADVPELSHMEILMVEPDRNEIYDELLVWLDRWSEGTVTVPAFE